MTVLMAITVLQLAFAQTPESIPPVPAHLPFGDWLDPPVWKNGGDDPIFECLSEGEDGQYILTQPEDIEGQCSFSAPPYGVFIRLEYGQMVVFPEQGVINWGAARISPRGAPFKVIGDQVHSILSNEVVEVGVIENTITCILAKTGHTQVVACEHSTDTRCVRRGYLLLEGEYLELGPTGHVYAWEDTEGNDLSRNSSGCSVSGKGSLFSALWLLCLFIPAVRRRHFFGHYWPR